MRPKSIREFELVYFASLVVSLAIVALGWSAMMARLAGNPAMAMFGNGLVIGSIALGYGISLLLYYFIAHRGSVVAKWIFVVLEALGLLGAVMSLARGTVPAGITGVLTVAGWVLSIVMIWLLFRPDTKPWFKETTTGPDVESDPV